VSLLRTERKVAVIGSGPAGLSSSYFLNHLGHSATVFEALPEAGGMLRVGIPPFRLPREVLNREIKEIEDAGVEIRTHYRIQSAAELFSSGFEAIFVAVGAHKGIELGIPGGRSEGVLDGVTFLRAFSLGREVILGERVAVIGGGNVAFDSARSALRLAAREVTIFYRRSRKEMPAYEEEREAALEEGVKIEHQAAPIRIERVQGGLEVEFIRMGMGSLDERGRLRPIPIEGSEFRLEFDSVISAIGQQSEVPEGVQISFDGGIGPRINPAKGVFLGGDLLTGPKTVIDAIASGRAGAILIDKFLGGDGNLDQSFSKREAGVLSPGISAELIVEQGRASIPVLPARERLSGFSEVNLGLTRQAAVVEAKRCLGCDLRFQIKRAILPPESWLPLVDKNIQSLPETEGVYVLYNEQKEIHQISGVENLRKALEEELERKGGARFFSYEKDPMFTSRERQLIQQYLKKHGKMPPGNDELDDLF